ncbi:hypothetical protein AN90_04072 [Mycobacterium tuberculosis M1384]|nr:hypothetical protein RN07_3008 [Mycobacterium tuberculosis variant bovis]KAL02752.1 hypothetical protein T580_04060 [Mycobacterium tuberculosis UT0046]KAX07691.1 hypothetical protein AN35_02629 [Mycobacterium tuberculosis M990]KAX13842.1 hypothetical protein AN37_02916 [Mycobacterium tuberculosis M1004]KAX30570.1 hypothetical protein AN41_03379 [Mycobacterium tuberculosis M1008]KAX50103.1 hypothetical protein AN47_02614 [Mycobacterium tuberculosis M1021]KAX56715.1 hypothetical protein AN48
MPSPFLSRQTQNPERGRKLLLSNAIIRRRSSASSDPKPREGTETRETAPSLAGAA